MRRVGSSIFCSSCLHHIFTGRNLINVSTIEPGFAPSGEEPLLLLGWTLLGSWTQTLSGPASTSVNTNTRLYCLLEWFGCDISFFQPFTDMCEQKKAITCILASCSYLRDRETSRLRLCFFLLRNGFCLRKLSFRFTNVADGSRTDGGCRRFAIISLAEVVSWFETRRARVQRSS